MEEMPPTKKATISSISEVVDPGHISRQNAKNYFASFPGVGMNGSKAQMLHVLPFPIVHRNDISAEPVDLNGPENIITLPSRLAIPVGIAQIVVGVSMVGCGTFALRYQSYLFYYGSGLWAGLLAGLAGILAIMETKTGLQKPKWLCGRRKWQIRIFLSAVIMALAAAVLTAIFSTTGLVRDTQYDYSKESIRVFRKLSN
ncbi:unnamed protein product [Allacma fusca]|uniref:Transmembrane protein n=1 Tax=Allacma fusca TaxID=39272 RepID=A0A8J2L625_9HEXA|nr:unnamed protein product [Allacma fusca]